MQHITVKTDHIFENSKFTIMNSLKNLCFHALLKTDISLYRLPLDLQEEYKKKQMEYLCGDKAQKSLHEENILSSSLVKPATNQKTIMTILHQKRLNIMLIRGKYIMEKYGGKDPDSSGICCIIYSDMKRQTEICP